MKRWGSNQSGSIFTGKFPKEKHEAFSESSEEGGRNIRRIVHKEINNETVRLDDQLARRMSDECEEFVNECALKYFHRIATNIARPL